MHAVNATSDVIYSLLNADDEQSPEYSSSSPMVHHKSGVNAYHVESRLHHLPILNHLHVMLHRHWQASKQWDWNLITVSFLAFFFFLLYVTSPAGRFISQHAACPVEVPMFDVGRHHGGHQHSPIESKTGALQGAAASHTLEAHMRDAHATPPKAVVPVTLDETPPASPWTTGTATPLITRHASLQSVSSSHKASGIRKSVHLSSASGIPHLLQFAETTFAPEDTTERHVHASATEIFYVRAGIMTVYFDADDEESTTVTAATAAAGANSTRNAATRRAAAAPAAAVVHHLVVGDSIAIPPGRWHRVANTHDTDLELVYATIHTP